MGYHISFGVGQWVDVAFDGFKVSTDQIPVADGGVIPSPYQLFFTSIAACAGVFFKVNF